MVFTLSIVATLLGSTSPAQLSADTFKPVKVYFRDLKKCEALERSNKPSQAETCRATATRLLQEGFPARMILEASKECRFVRQRIEEGAASYKMGLSCVSKKELGGTLSLEFAPARPGVSAISGDGGAFNGEDLTDQGIAARYENVGVQKKFTATGRVVQDYAQGHTVGTSDVERTAIILVQLTSLEYP